MKKAAGKIVDLGGGSFTYFRRFEKNVQFHPVSVQVLEFNDILPKVSFTQEHKKQDEISSELALVKKNPAVTFPVKAIPYKQNVETKNKVNEDPKKRAPEEKGKRDEAMLNNLLKEHSENGPAKEVVAERSKKIEELKKFAKSVEVQDKVPNLVKKAAKSAEVPDKVPKLVKKSKTREASVELSRKAEGVAHRREEKLKDTKNSGERADKLKEGMHNKGQEVSTRKRSEESPKKGSVNGSLKKVERTSECKKRSEENGVVSDARDERKKLDEIRRKPSEGDIPASSKKVEERPRKPSVVDLPRNVVDTLKKKDEERPRKTGQGELNRGAEIPKRTAEERPTSPQANVLKTVEISDTRTGDRSRKAFESAVVEPSESLKTSTHVQGKVPQRDARRAEMEAISSEIPKRINPFRINSNGVQPSVAGGTMPSIKLMKPFKIPRKVKSPSPPVLPSDPLPSMVPPVIQGQPSFKRIRIDPNPTVDKIFPQNVMDHSSKSDREADEPRKDPEYVEKSFGYRPASKSSPRLPELHVTVVDTNDNASESEDEVDRRGGSGASDEVDDDMDVLSLDVSDDEFL